MRAGLTRRKPSPAFADLGFGNAEELRVRADLIRQVNKTIKQRGLTQSEVARLIGFAQSDVSLLMRGTVTRFSTERIIRVLVRLGHDLDILVKRRSASEAECQVRVKAA